MRQLKFRAWDGSLMLLFSLDSLRDNYGDDCCMTPKGEDAPPHSGLNWPVMQFTGLQDSKGVEIYEGDIVRISAWNGYTWNAAIEWYENGAKFTAGAGSAMSGSGNYTVIGNIHENLELLLTGHHAERRVGE